MVIYIALNRIPKPYTQGLDFRAKVFANGRGLCLVLLTGLYGPEFWHTGGPSIFPELPLAESVATPIPDGFIQGRIQPGFGDLVKYSLL